MAIILLNLLNQQFLSGNQFEYDPWLCTATFNMLKCQCLSRHPFVKKILIWTELRSRWKEQELSGLRLYLFSLLMGSSRLWWFPNVKNVLGCQIEKAYKVHSLLQNVTQEYVFQIIGCMTFTLTLNFETTFFSQYRYSSMCFWNDYSHLFNESLNIKCHDNWTAIVPPIWLFTHW